MSAPAPGVADVRGPGWLSDPEGGAAPYVLELYVIGASPRSQLAVGAVREVCERHLSGRYALRVIDVRQQPELARAEQLVALPTLVKRGPRPVRRLVGDMSDTRRLLAGLDIAADPPASTA